MQKVVEPGKTEQFSFPMMYGEPSRARVVVDAPLGAEAWTPPEVWVTLGERFQVGSPYDRVPGVLLSPTAAPIVLRDTVGQGQVVTVYVPNDSSLPIEVRVTVLWLPAPPDPDRELAVTTRFERAVREFVRVFLAR